MTRTILGSIYNAFRIVYITIRDFWDTWSAWFVLLPVVQTIILELAWCLYWITDSLWRLLYWWDNIRTTPTLLSDWYNIIFFLRTGFENYVLGEGDPGNIGRIIYYPAGFAYRFLQGLEVFFSTFNTIILNIQAAIANILDWATIKSLIKTWLPKLEDTVAWFSDWWKNILAKIIDWWGLVDNPIRVFILAKIVELADVVDSVRAALAAIKAFFEELELVVPTLGALFLWFKDWGPTTLKPIRDWWAARVAEIQEQIEKTLKAKLPFLAELVALWESIKAFFADPVEFIWAKFTDWFLGPEV